MKKVCFYPSCQRRSNPFLFNIARLLESSGQFECASYKDVKRDCPKRIYNYDVYHLNWFDQSKTFVSFLKRLYFILKLKLLRKEIVWTIHNITSHIKTPFYNKILNFCLKVFSDKIHIMCSGTISQARLKLFKGKICFIRHGDYFQSYPESDFDVCAFHGIERTKKIFLFIGAIQPYKNIEVLIKAYTDAFQNVMEKPVLLICGKSELKKYQDNINELLEENNDIIFYPKFIPDEKISAYLRTSSILIAPYDYRSSLNSGTIPLAFSYGKTIICSDIECVKDIVDDSDCLYSYHYSSEIEHVKNLSKKMQQCFCDMKSASIQEKEKNAILYMEKNSWKAKQKEWLNLYGV